MCKELCNKRLGTLAIVMQGTSLGDILQKFVQSLHGLLGESVESSLDSLRVYAVLDFWIFEGNLKTSDEKKRGGKTGKLWENCLCILCQKSSRSAKGKEFVRLFLFRPGSFPSGVVSEDLYVSKSFASHRERSPPIVLPSLFFLSFTFLTRAESRQREIS